MTPISAFSSSPLSGLPLVGCFFACQIHSSPHPIFPRDRPFSGSSLAAFTRSASNDNNSSSSPAAAAGAEEEFEPKLQSPYHFSLSSNEEKAPEAVHHYHPEPYPEGISDEKVTNRREDFIWNGSRCHTVYINGICSVLWCVLGMTMIWRATCQIIW